ncbi:MAG: MFS transporter [Muribaculaceae bacterium]|nr:MFS transporter [Muribaculaceae bacterium]
MNPLKVRLAAMNFIEFAVWGAYLTSLGAYLSNAGLGYGIGWFYAIQGIVSIFMPAIVGIIADRWIPAQKMLSLCHLLAGIFMMGAGFYGYAAGAEVQFGPLFALYTVSVAFFMPTIGLANSVCYNAMERANMDTIKEFPPIRVLGTVGFIVAMLITNFTGFQNNYWQMVFSGALSLLMVVYALTMPNCPVSKSDNNKGLVDALGLRAFTLFKDKSMAIFFIFSMLLGVSLQITNGFANPFISSFAKIAEFADSWGAQNANALISISQISETLCILLIPFFLKRFGIKIVMMMAMIAWFLRFGLFGVGNPGGGVIFLILSMIVYGVAFDFFNVSGSLYVDQKVDGKLRSSAQGLFMLMTNGIGATVGTLSAQAIVDKVVFTQPEGTMQYAQGWSNAWLIFAAYALAVAILFWICFRNPNKDKNITTAEIKDIPSKSDDPAGEVLV